MNNLIKKTPYSTKINLSHETVKNLKSYTPKGCPFQNYTLFDLLMDFIEMHSWKICGVLGVNDFIRVLQDEKYDKAVVYGNAILSCLSE